MYMYKSTIKNLATPIFWHPFTKLGINTSNFGKGITKLQSYILTSQSRWTKWMQLLSVQAPSGKAHGCLREAATECRGTRVSRANFNVSDGSYQLTDVPRRHARQENNLQLPWLKTPSLALTQRAIKISGV